MVKRLLIEAAGWILAVTGGIFVFGDKETHIIHYVFLIAGILIIIVYFPKNIRGKRE